MSLGPDELIAAAEADELFDVLNDPSCETAIERFRSLTEERLRDDKVRVPEQFDFGDELRYQLLRFVVDEERSRGKLQALADRSPDFDQDKKVLNLWKVIKQSSAMTGFRSITYHQRRLFSWFVDRYDLLRGRQVYTDRAWLHTGLQFVPTIGAALGLYLISIPTIPWMPFLVVLAGYAIPALAWRLSRLPLFDFIQSLVPRLAGTASAGAALLLSSDLLKFFHAEMRLMGSMLLLAPAVFYLGLEVQHRVRPRLRLRELVNRVASVVFLALTHAAAIVVFVSPAIRYLLVANGALPPSKSLCISELFAFTTALFTAGLVLNVIWAEEPITRPL